MTNTYTASPNQNRISVFYGDRAHAFWLAEDASLAELAVLVCGLDELHDSEPTSVVVDHQRSRVPATTASIRKQLSA